MKVDDDVESELSLMRLALAVWMLWDCTEFMAMLSIRIRVQVGRCVSLSINAKRLG